MKYEIITVVYQIFHLSLYGNDVRRGLVYCDCDHKRHTIPACNTSGAYTIHVNGAIHTPRISQFQIIFAVSSGANRSHPNPMVMYATYLILRVAILEDGEANDRGSPRRVAKVAAREKLRTDVMDITVEAKHRLSALINDERGATVDDLGGEEYTTTAAGRLDMRTANTGASACCTEV